MSKTGEFFLSRIVWITVAVGMSFFLTKPLIDGDYFYPVGEFELLKSFLVNFVHTLRSGDLPVWNPFVGNGHPAMYFGHYPINHNTLIYLIFGFSDGVFYGTRFLNLSILFASFLLIRRYLGVSWLVALTGAVIYFSINFVDRKFIPETLGSLVFLYPLLMVFAMKIARQPRKDKTLVLLFVLTYVVWLSGGNITYIPMHLLMLMSIYVVSYLFFKVSFQPKKIGLECGWLFLLFVAPITLVAYQYIFVIDVILDSNRLKPGLIVGIGNAEPWGQLFRSLCASSYFWVSGLGFSLFGAYKFWITRQEPGIQDSPRYIFLGAFSLMFIAIFLVWISRDGLGEVGDALLAVGYDYSAIATSVIFIISLFAVLGLEIGYRRVYLVEHSPKISWVWLAVSISLISHFFFSPENIMGDVNGYNFDLFRELSKPIQFIFLSCVFLASVRANKLPIVRVSLVTLIVLYVFESHLTIPLMRFTGFIWYATRDGIILSALFCFLFIFGFQTLIEDYVGTFIKRYLQLIRNGELRPLRRIIKNTGRSRLMVKPRRSRGLENRRVIAVTQIVAGAVLVSVLGDAHEKLYLGTSHRYIFPKNQTLLVSGWDRAVWKATEAVPSLSRELQEQIANQDGFSRLFSPENHYTLLAGHWQSVAVYEAGIYDSSISAAYQEFFDILFDKQRSTTTGDLVDALPYFLFTRHVHEGLGLSSREIPYGDFFLFDPRTDLANLSENNFRLFLNLMQVKFILVRDKFGRVLDQWGGPKGFKLIREFPEIDHLYLYKTLWPTPSGRYAFLPKNDNETFDALHEQLNSSDLNVLQALYDRLIFNADQSETFVVNRHAQPPRLLNGLSESKVITASPGYVIHFDSWNKNWEYSLNGGVWEKPTKAFHLFRAVKTNGGSAEIKERYRLPFFREFFLTGMVAFIGLLFLLLTRLYISSRSLKKSRDNPSVEL